MDRAKNLKKEVSESSDIVESNYQFLGSQTKLHHKERVCILSVPMYLICLQLQDYSNLI